MGVIEPFIRHVRFPRFKNLEPGLRIDFQYPITALVGTNGTNKSSVLRALQGCPNQYNIGDYWFDTQLDAIASGDPQRYIHGYQTPSGALAEVIKARVGKTERGLDYFETSAPRRRDGMASMPKLRTVDADLRSKTRWKPIEKNVVYLDFRQELPAYDILFHFNWRKMPNDVDSKKKRIRRGAPHVAQALDGLEATHTHYDANRILEPAEELAPEEVTNVESILGREYQSIRLVRHDLFGVEGYTARLANKHHNYSEAYAGSGEFAAIMLVRAISRAPQGSLILLDEPETSLHPGAQKAFLRFVARECVKRKHQVVMATHSPSMVEGLPEEAVKLFDINPVNGKVRIVAQRAAPSEAFNRLGATLASRTIVVEDVLAEAFVTRVARDRGRDYLASIEVRVVPGGAESILKNVVPVEAQLDASSVILLDGDKRPPVRPRRSEAVTDHEVHAELGIVGISASDILRNGGDGDSRLEQTRQQRKTLVWINDHLDYLPSGVSPDELLLNMAGLTPAANSAEAKDIWKSIAKADLGLLPDESPTSRQISDTQMRALAKVPADDSSLVELAETLARVVPVA